MSARAADLTLEQHRLSQRQDAIRLALTTTRHDAGEWPRLSPLNATVFRRSGQIRREKQAEVARLEGSRAQWRVLRRSKRALAQTAARRRGSGRHRGVQSQILAGDPRVAVLVLAAVIDHNLHQSDARREDIEYVDGLTRCRPRDQCVGAVER
jgi:hypothetical protein